MRCLYCGVEMDGNEELAWDTCPDCGPDGDEWQIALILLHHDYLRARIYTLKARDLPGIRNAGATAEIIAVYPAYMLEETSFAPDTPADLRAMISGFQQEIANSK